MNTPLYVAMVLGIVVLAASVISVELGLSVAVVEIVALKAAGKFVGVYPLARRYLREHASYTTLLMSTAPSSRCWSRWWY